MKYVTSNDGTEICYEKEGEGKPIVMVHGTSDTRQGWEIFKPCISDEYSTVVYDRRGRGDSGDSSEYSLGSEVADAHAVLEDVDGIPVLFGHSFGGLVALEAARTANIDRLVLYEPAILTDRFRENADLVSRMERRVENGDRQGAVELYFEEAPGIENPNDELMERSLELLDTILRENRVVEGYKIDGSVDLGVPTLLLVGEHGPDHLRDSIQRLHNILDESQIVELECVGHVATMSDPEQLAVEIHSFLEKF